MQLFVTHPVVSDTQLTISEPRLIKYMGRVLRMQSGDVCWVQREENGTSTRREVQLTEITKKHIVGHILDTKKKTDYLSHTDLLVCLPNKFSKLELIVQKCTEVGIDTIYLRPSQRSLLKTISEKRMERLRTIALESVEQCKRRAVPAIQFIKSPEQCLENKQVLVFDFVDREKKSPPAPLSPEHMDVVGVVGPEGHFGEKDYEILQAYEYTPIGLGDHVLRTETAAIVGAWYLCNRTR